MRSALGFLNEFNNLVQVFCGFHLGVTINDFALLIDNEGPASRRIRALQHNFLAIHRALDRLLALLHRHAIFLCNGSVGIGKQGKVELVRPLEKPKAFGGVPADSDDFNIQRYADQRSYV